MPVTMRLNNPAIAVIATRNKRFLATPADTGIREGCELMSREAKGWLFTTFGIAFLVTALLARSWRNWDEPPPVSIPG
ncbi:MAG: hypothetical protein JJ992_27805, partial [Planctomycetes bacterium]|nr:hypothetical protein [Planctomycetota bacterium]